MGCVRYRTLSLLRCGDVPFVLRLHELLAGPPRILSAIRCLQRTLLKRWPARCGRELMGQDSLVPVCAGVAELPSRLGCLKRIEFLRPNGPRERCRKDWRGDQSCYPQSGVICCFVAQDSSPYTKSEELGARSME